MAESLVSLKNANIYQGTNLILQDVNINVDKGEFVYLVGKTGTGKSSLLKTLYGDLPLKEGEGVVAGYNLKQMDWKKVPFLPEQLLQLIILPPVVYKAEPPIFLSPYLSLSDRLSLI